MRIIYLHQYFNTRKMAGGTRSYELARRLADRGHEVDIITSWREKSGQSGWFRTEIDGIRVHWLPVKYSNYMSYKQRMGAFFNFAIRSTYKAAALKGDVIYATSTPLTIALPGIFASRWHGIPMIFEVRDLWPEVPIVMGALQNRFLKVSARKLEKFAYRNSAKIVALSPGIAEGILDTGYSKKDLCVIPNSSDVDLFRPDNKLSCLFRKDYPELGDGPIILYPGTIGKINGVEYMAQLACNVLNIRNDCRFVAIGDGIELDNVRLVAQKLGVLNRNFFIYPPMPKNDLVSAFCAASVILSLVIDHPIMEINCANKFFDALASGTPIAINYDGWQAEIIRKYSVGIVLPRNTMTAAKILTEFLNNPKLISQSGRSARNLATSSFSRDIMVERLEKLILDTVREFNK